MLGALLGGNPVNPDPAQQQESQSKWQGWLSNPINQAGLVSFGLQALTGGWGGPGQQLAAALGAGIEGAAGQEKLMHDEEVRAEAAATARSDKARTFAQRDRELNIQEERTRGLNARGGTASKGFTLANRVYADNFKALTDDISGPGLSPEEAHSIALERALATVQSIGGKDAVSSANAGPQGAGLKIPGGTQGPKGTAKKSAENSATKGDFPKKLSEMTPAQIARIRNMAVDPVKRQKLEAEGIEIPTDPTQDLVAP